jgi:hypothetical protein
MNLQFKSNFIWQALPLLATFVILLQTLLGINSSTIQGVPIIRFLIFAGVPGLYISLILGKSFHLKDDVIIALDITISLAINTLLVVYLSLFVNRISEEVLSLSIFLITLLTFILYQYKRITRPLITVNRIQHLPHIIVIFISFLIGFAFIVQVIPDYYWKGYDPWLNTPIVQQILQKGINPFEIPEQYGETVALSGFYYFLAGGSSYSGINLYYLNRYGGALSAGLVCMLLYVLISKYEGKKFGLIACIFLSLNPFFVERFSMALRENFAFIFLLIEIFLVVIRDENTNIHLNFNYTYVLLSGVFLSITLSAHSLTPIFSYGFVIIQMCRQYITKKFTAFKENLFAIILSVILSFTHLTSALSYFIDRVSTHWLLPFRDYLVIGLVITTLIVVYLLKKNPKIRILTSLQLSKQLKNVLLGVLLLGALIAIIFQKRFEFLGVWQPPIELTDFSISVMPLAFIGFSIAILSQSLPNFIDNFAFLLLSLLNLTNLNIAFPQFRLLIYASVLLPYGAIIGTKAFCRSNSQLKTFKVKQNAVILCLLFVMLLFPFVILDITDQQQAKSYFNDHDIESAVTFTSLVTDSDIVIPQALTSYLLRHVNLDTDRIFHIVSNFTVDQTVYSITDYDEFVSYIKLYYPDIDRAMVFIISRYLSDSTYYTPSIDMLERNAEKQHIGTVLVYYIHLAS